MVFSSFSHCFLLDYMYLNGRWYFSMWVNSWIMVHIMFFFPGPRDFASPSAEWLKIKMRWKALDFLQFFLLLSSQLPGPFCALSTQNESPEVLMDEATFPGNIRNSFWSGQAFHSQVKGAKWFTNISQKIWDIDLLLPSL